MLALGAVQRNLRVPRTIRKQLPAGGAFHWIAYSATMVNADYYYQNTHLKQQHKDGSAPRTETTIKNSYDLVVGHPLSDLPRLRQIGSVTNRRLLEVETLGHDRYVGADAFAQLQCLAHVQGQHAPALTFTQVGFQAFFAVLALFSVPRHRFHNKHPRPFPAQPLPDRRGSQPEPDER